MRPLTGPGLDPPARRAIEKLAPALTCTAETASANTTLRVLDASDAQLQTAC